MGKSTSAMPAAAPYTPASLKKQTVPELRALCTDIGVESFGRKDDLITRVLGASTPAKKAAPPTPTSVAPRVADLKSWLSEHGLSTKGLKDELLSRYQDAKDKLSGAAGMAPSTITGIAPSQLPVDEKSPSPVKAASPSPEKAPSIAADPSASRGWSYNPSNVDDSDCESYNPIAADAAENSSVWPVVVALTVIVLLLAWHVQNGLQTA